MSSAVAQHILADRVHMPRVVRKLLEQFGITVRPLNLFEIALGNGQQTLALSNFRVDWPRDTQVVPSENGQIAYIYLPCGITLWTPAHDEEPRWVDMWKDEPWTDI